MRLVRWLFGLAVVATALWCGYWFVGAQALQLAVDQVLDAPESPLRAEEASVRGFPNRFDLTLTRPELRQPGVAWSAPFVQVFALSYRPHHVVAVFPPQQRLALGGADWQVGTTDGRASVVMAPARRLELDRAVVVLQGLALDGPLRLGADALRLAIRREGPGYAAVAELDTAFPDPEALDAADPARLWPRRFDVLRLDAALEFDRPLDLDALTGGGALPPPRVALTGARAAWDAVDLRLSGRVDLGTVGGPAGDLVVAVEGWRALLDLLDRTGALSPELGAWLAAAGPGLSRPGAPDAVDIPLRVEAGQVRLGPLVLFDLASR